MIPATPNYRSTALNNPDSSKLKSIDEVIRLIAFFLK
jgi:hypothetical protein